MINDFRKFRDFVIGKLNYFEKIITLYINQSINIDDLHKEQMKFFRH